MAQRASPVGTENIAGQQTPIGRREDLSSSLHRPDGPQAHLQPYSIRNVKEQMLAITHIQEASAKQYPGRELALSGSR